MIFIIIMAVLAIYVATVEEYGKQPRLIKRTDDKMQSHKGKYIYNSNPKEW